MTFHLYRQLPLICETIYSGKLSYTEGKRICTLERQIAKIKQDIDTIGDLCRGSLSEQYNVCGTSGCKCKATPPEKHGPITS
jgi:hypothetical protein